MNRRNFIQRFVYSLLVLIFGPGVLEQLDIEAAERVIDELVASPLDDRDARVDMINPIVHFSFDGLFSRDVCP